MRRLYSELRSRQALTPDDSGFTVLEVVITVAIMAIVISATTSIIMTLLSDNAGMVASVQGTEQAEVASQTFVQYLESAGDPSAAPTEVCSESPFLTAGEDGIPSNATITSAGGDSMTFASYIGYGSDGTGTESPTAEIVQASLSLGSKTAGNVFSVFTVAIEPAWGTTPRTVTSYDVASSPTSPVFSYYFEPSPGDLEPISLVNNLVPSGDLGEIAAVGYSIPFMAPPGHNVGGYSEDAVTELSDTVFLQNCQ